jgi:hypothetical protein
MNFFRSIIFFTFFLMAQGFAQWGEGKAGNLEFFDAVCIYVQYYEFTGSQQEEVRDYFVDQLTQAGIPFSEEISPYPKERRCPLTNVFVHVLFDNYGYFFSNGLIVYANVPGLQNIAIYKQSGAIVRVGYLGAEAENAEYCDLETSNKEYCDKAVSLGKSYIDTFIADWLASRELRSSQQNSATEE